MLEQLRALIRRIGRLKEHTIQHRTALRRSTLGDAELEARAVGAERDNRVHE